MPRHFLRIVVIVVSLLLIPHAVQAAGVEQGLGTTTNALACPFTTSGSTQRISTDSYDLVAGYVVTFTATKSNPASGDRAVVSVNDGVTEIVFVMATPTATATFTIPASGLYFFTAGYFSGGASGGDPEFDPINFTITINCAGSATGGNSLTSDGRMNGDPVQQAAVYPQFNADGSKSLIIYAVTNSQGHYAFSVTQAEIDAVPTHPAVNTLIKEALGIRLYRLTSGELQINAPADDHDYVFIFNWP